MHAILEKNLGESLSLLCPWALVEVEPSSKIFVVSEVAGMLETSTVKIKKAAVVASGSGLRVAQFKLCCTISRQGAFYRN